jgi:hypothetical protein
MDPDKRSRKQTAINYKDMNKHGFTKTDLNNERTRGTTQGNADQSQMTSGNQSADGKKEWSGGPKFNSEAN